jgi:hypothetical protein
MDVHEPDFGPPQEVELRRLIVDSEVRRLLQPSV